MHLRGIPGASQVDSRCVSGEFQESTKSRGVRIEPDSPGKLFQESLIGNAKIR